MKLKENYSVYKLFSTIKALRTILFLLKKMISKISFSSIKTVEIGN